MNTQKLVLILVLALVIRHLMLSSKNTFEDFRTYRYYQPTARYGNRYGTRYPLYPYQYYGWNHRYPYRYPRRTVVVEKKINETDEQKEIAKKYPSRETCRWLYPCNE